MKALSEGTDNKKRPFGILIRFTVLFAAVFSISAAGIKAENISRTLDEIMPQTEDFDFTRTVMRLSSLADPRLNISVETSRVRSMAAEIKERIRPGASGREAVYVINQYLYEMKGFGFDERANEYILKKTVNPAAVDINNYESFRHVLRKRKGICVSLSMLYLMIADELKLPVFGVFVPGHIFVRYESEMDRINIETTSRGSFVPDSEYESEFNTRFNGGLYGKSLSKRRSLGAFLNNLGVAFIRDGRFNDAAAVLEKAVELNSGDSLAYNNLSSAYLGAKMYDKALVSIRKSAALTPENADTILNLAVVYYNMQRYDSAFKNAQKALKLDPSYAAAFELAGRILYDTQKYRESIPYFIKAAALNQNFEPAITGLADAYRKTGDNVRALKYYRKALLVNPKSPAAHNNLGIIYSETNRHGLAIDSYLKALEYSDNPLTKVNLASSYYAAGMKRSAIRQYEEALEMDEDIKNIHYNMGVVYQDMGMLDNALESYKKAAEKSGGSPEIYSSMGSAYYDKGRYDEAVVYYRKASETAPSFALFFNTGAALFRAGRYKEAVREYEKALQLKPENVNALNNIAAAYQRLGNNEAAEKYMNRAERIRQ